MRQDPAYQGVIMKFCVTRKHIKSGQCKSVYYCPLALAIKEEGFSPVMVYDNYAVIGHRTYDIRRGIRFINKFDRGLPVKPSTFELVPAR
jgi:hypothetical protein